MRIGYFLILGLALFFGSCSTKVKNLDTPEGTLAEAERLMEDHFFEEAREQYFRIKTEFPNSDLLARADLRVADSYFLDDSWPAAADAYEEFVRTYPGHSQVPYALFRMGMSYVKQMPNHPQRDSRSARRAINNLTRLLVDFPQSPYAEKAAEEIQKAQLLLARKSFQIAKFYEKKDHYEAAANRYAQVVDLFPESPLVEEAAARRIRMLKRAGKKEKAKNLIRDFEQRYPSSGFLSIVRP